MRQVAIPLTVFAAVLALLLGAHTVVAQTGGKVKRAAPPKWTRTVTEVFATDVRSNLSGERPVFGGQATAVAGSTPAAAADPSTPMASGAEGPFAWSKLITPEALEREIKSYQSEVATEVKTASQFKGGGAKNIRKHFTMLALAFEVIAQYDGQVRWKNQALAARELFGRAGFNAKVATDQSFNESKLRNEDLKTLLSGESVQVPPNIDPKQPWAKIVSRPPLMSRLETAQQTRLSPWLANKADFDKNVEQVSHEAQIVAAISEVIEQEGFENSDDDTYKEYSTAMKKAALAIVEACKTKNYDAANAANGAMSKACADCHSGFRS